jgi:hypothetical protein
LAHLRLVGDRRAALIGEHNMDRVIKVPLVAMSGAFALLLGLAAPLSAATAAGAVTPQFRLAQAMVPPTGMMDAQRPSPRRQPYRFARARP